MAHVQAETVSKWRLEAEQASEKNDLNLAEESYQQLIEAQMTNGEDPSHLLRDRYNYAGILLRQQKFGLAEAQLKVVLPALRNRTRPIDDEESVEHFRQQEEGAERLLIQAVKAQGKEYKP